MLRDTQLLSGRAGVVAQASWTPDPVSATLCCTKRAAWLSGSFCPESSGGRVVAQVVEEGSRKGKRT